jgi:hypothetical protein
MKREEAPPPPSPALLDAVAKMKPVRTRVPWRALVIAIALFLAYGALFPLHGVRSDMGFLPEWWVLAVGAVWLMGLIAPLSFAFLPRRGQVLPDGSRALFVSLITTSIILLVSAFLPGVTSHAQQREFVDGLGHCLRFALPVAILPVAIGMMGVRRLAPVGSWRVGAAIGAAGGALSGLILHLLCPIASGLHVACAHGGAVILCAIAGALIAPPILRN